MKTETFLFQVGICYLVQEIDAKTWTIKLHGKLLLWIIEYLMSYGNETVKH
jgi:hypothetical protein